MDFSEFSTISIRGRVAFGIKCLENAITHFNFSIDKWGAILNLLWSYTSESPAEWHYKVAESTPQSILGDEFIEEEMEYLSKDQYGLFKQTYEAHSNEVINSIVHLIFWIGTQELYGKISSPSTITLSYLQQLIEIMNKHFIPIPKTEPFLKFSIKENDGWGIAFKPSEVD